MAPYFMPYFTSCRRAFRLGAIAVAVALLASVACAHNDVVPYSNGTKIVTGGHDDLAGTTDELLSVFGYDFGEDPNDPWVIGDPGFNNSSAFTTSFPNAGALPAGALALSVFSGNYGSLHYWDGTGTSAAFSPVASGVEINLNRGSSNLRIGGATASGSLSIATISAAGRVHNHLQTSLGTGGSGGSFTNLGAADGIYAFGATFSSGGLSSDPIYFVFNAGMSEAIHDVGIDFYATQAVPEPSCFALVTLGVAVLAFGRKRHR
jgi:hypothetical protein